MTFGRPAGGVLDQGADRRLDHRFDHRSLDQLSIEDERSFRHVGLYGDLKQVLRRAEFRFRVLPAQSRASWDRALFLNLTYWRPDAGGDVLVDDSIPADVVAHVAWHHLASAALGEGSGAAPPVESLFMGEAIASAFDLYLVGRLLGHAPESTFLETQVPAMKDVAEAAGLDEDAFAGLLDEVARDPERAFADLRALLFDASTALYACADAEAALGALTRLDGHRFAPLLHRYELSNWILYARAHGREPNPDTSTSTRTSTRELDQRLRDMGDPLGWLAREWVAPALPPL